tara:strand:- start:18721 stop:19749 length:1029 start_codon:yes stop_codon:yes gene_type:complete
MKSISDFEVEDKDIVIFVIGAGAGGSAAIDAVVTKFPYRTVIYAFEAREFGDHDKKAYQQYLNLGVRVVIINRAVSGKSGLQKFYLNKQTPSSSLLPPSEKTINDHIVPFTTDQKITTWGENTELDKEVELDAITLKEFIDKEGVTPDLIVADVQGMELEVIKGMGDYIKDVGALFTEVEFYEIYKGQALFSDQSQYYETKNIRLAEMYGMQRWHPAPAAGGGFLTVAEALWVRTVDSVFDWDDGSSLLNNMKFIKQAAIAFCYDKLSYTYAILEGLCVKGGNTEEFRNQVRDMCDSLGYNRLVKLHHHINANLNNYKENNKFFLDNTGEALQIRDEAKVAR